MNFIRQTIRNLKHAYGEPCIITVVESEETNFNTGNTNTYTTDYTVRKAIEVPQNSGRKFAYDIAYLAANKNFTYGGQFDVDAKILLVDAQDLPKTFVPTFDNIITFRGIKYKIAKIDMMAEKVGWIFIIKGTTNEYT